MINQLRALSLKYFKPYLTPLNLFNRKPVGYYFSKDERDQEGRKVINLSNQEIDKIKHILAKGQNILQDQQEKGQDFFQGEQAKLSLQLIQIDTLEQLKPLIKNYSTPLITKEIDQVFKQSLRCKFLVLFKYVNLQGSLFSKQIQQLYKDIITNLQYLDQHELTVFFRMIAHNEQIKAHFRKYSKSVVLIDKPSHTNSQIMSLLLMIYPQQKDEIYKHYFLHFTKKQQDYREGITQKPKQMIYDPINLMHILSNYYYYDDVQKLMECTMKIKSIQDTDCFLEEFVTTQQEFIKRKVAAIIIAIQKQMEPVSAKYINKQYIDLNKLKIHQTVSLLRSIACNDKISPQNVEAIRECSNILIQNILNKGETIISDDEEQELQESTNYAIVGQVITGYIRKKQQFLSKDLIISLMNNIFGRITLWTIQYNLYPIQTLFTLIVAYKASKDFMKNNGKELDESSKVFVRMVTAYNQLMSKEQKIDQKQLFYVCLFAYQLQSLQNLKDKNILLRLRAFGKGQISVAARENLNAIIKQLQSQQ